MFINKDSIVVFWGDSITCGNRIMDDENSLGDGYVFFIDTYFKSIYPNYSIKFINEGVIGDGVLDLKNRLNNQIIDLKPDIVTILIGANDIWNKYYGDVYLNEEEFFFHYDDIVSDLVSNNVKKIVLMEPFLISVNNDISSWRKELYTKIDIVRRLAKKYNCIYIPLDSIFGELCTTTDPHYWSSDGIHPNIKGHFIIARTWIQMMNGWI